MAQSHTSDNPYSMHGLRDVQRSEFVSGVMRTSKLRTGIESIGGNLCEINLHD